MQTRIPAVWMRGGTSKGIFFHQRDLPQDPDQRDAILLRVLGSPDPYGNQIDGLGGGTSSTSKAVMIQRSDRPDCDVDYLFAHVAIGDAVVDTSGNCGNLTAAVGLFAVEEDLVPPREGHTPVAIWQVNTQRKIIVHVPVKHGHAISRGNFSLAGVAFPGAEIEIDFLDPAGGATGQLLPTGHPVDRLDIPGLGPVEATLIDAGNPSVFIRASDVGLSGYELPAELNQDGSMLQLLETIRCQASVAMGLADNLEQAARERPATPKIAFVAPPHDYLSSSGVKVSEHDIDLSARILSMGKPHHAFTGTGAIAVAVAANLPGTLVAEACASLKQGRLSVGHAAGTLRAGAEVFRDGHGWHVRKARLSRTARRLMEGHVLIPGA